MSKQRADEHPTPAADDVAPDVEEVSAIAADLDDAPADDGEPTLNKHGYPDGTPLAEMSTAQQAAYWKHKARVHENRSKAKPAGLTPEEVQALRDEIDELRGAQLSDSERAQADAVETARAEGRTQARNELLPVLQEAQLRGYASTVVKGKRLDSFVSTANIGAFCTDDGEIDGAKVVTHLQALFGEDTSGAAAAEPKSTYPNYGQGSPGATLKGSTRSAGLAEAARRFPKAAA
ncbi:hypothetical protein ACQPW1_10060 [Nocardia sp. CA-128927]|uniref:hypothetical protein n=1 Tax=Nocardia sp. CA-128927 TaxID=3239975 RepID=UPI003D99C62B